MKLSNWIAPVVMALAAGAGTCMAQTTVDLSRQAKVEIGPQPPATCRTGQLFVKTSAPGVADLMVCTATNVWTPSFPEAFSAGSGIAITGTSIAVEDAMVPVYYAGAGAPTITCMAGRDFFVDTTGGALYFCGTPGEWQAVSLPGHTHSADQVTSGVLQAARLPAGLVLTGQANAFAAGQRQAFSHDGSNAGLRLTPAPGDPSGAQDGDVWYNSVTSKFRRYQNGTAMDWDISGAASINQANLFSPGQRQSVSHDATNAGLRLVPASGDPAGAQDGDVWYNLTTGKFRRRQSGSSVDWDAGGGAYSAGAGLSLSGTTFSYNPLDRTSFAEWDNFLPSTTNAGTVGKLGWTFLSIGASGCASALPAAAPTGSSPVRIGGYTFTTGAGSNLGCAIGLSASNNANGIFYNLSTYANWDFRWRIKTAASITAITIRVGLGPMNASNTTPPADGVFARYIAGTDTHWVFENCRASTCTTVDSGVPITTSAHYEFRLHSTAAGTYLASIATNGGAFSTEKTICSGACDINATPSNSSAVGPLVQLISNDPSAKALLLYFWGVSITGVVQ